MYDFYYAWAAGVHESSRQIETFRRQMMEAKQEMKIADLERQVECLKRDAKHTERVIAVLVAVGYISNAKLEQAREIVSGLGE